MHISVDEGKELLPAGDKSVTDVMLVLSKWADTVQAAYEELAPYKLCQFVYELSDAFNKFYHDNKIVTNENEAVRESFIKLSMLVGEILETAVGLLGLEAPDSM